jgi:hypothetical protein
MQYHTINNSRVFKELEKITLNKKEKTLSKKCEK